MSQGQSNPLGFGALLRDTAQLFFMHWRRHLALSFFCALPLAILYAMGYFDLLTDLLRAGLQEPQVQRLPNGTPSMTVSGPPDAALLPMRLLSLAALTLMIISAYAANWWSGLFELQQMPQGHAHRYFEDFMAVLARLVLVSAIMLAVAFALGVINSLLAQVLVPALSPLGAAQFVRFLISAVLQILLLGVGIRLVLAIPPILWEEHVPITRAWAGSAGTTIVLGSTALLLSVPPVILALLVGMLLGGGTANAGPIVQALTIIIMGPVVFLYHGLQLTLVATAFRKLREAERL